MLKFIWKNSYPILLLMHSVVIAAPTADYHHEHEHKIHDAHPEGQEAHGTQEPHDEDSGNHSADHQHHKSHGEHDDHENNSATITNDIAHQSNIALAAVKPETLEITTQAFGKLVIPPNREAHIHARFPGLVKDIKVYVGDRVVLDDVLAVIESNESLRDYTVKAPMSGIVTKRQINLGEITDDDPLVVIIDDTLLWAEIKIFPHQRAAVKQGQVAYLARDQRELSNIITHMAPSDKNAPYMLARVDVDNSAQKFTPGEIVRADIVVEKISVPIAVKNTALQTMNEQKVVFVKNGNEYERRSIKLGRTDGFYTEVLTGLDTGEVYVAENSFLIKADIEKAGAGHHH